ncbi:MAG: glycosyltransferase [Muribaculaceae bacterium]|nr:glycosyltransferase [Muribaculaceae bacterium]
MKRILFYSENFCGDKIKGGLEVATFRIAKALKDSGDWEVYNVFRSKSDGKEKSIYSDVIKLGKADFKFRKELAKFISDNEIDVVVNMSRFYRHPHIVKVVKESGRNVKIIFMQHFAPGSEMKKPTFNSGFHLLKLNPYNPLYWLRSSIYPILKLPRRFKFSNIYKSTYQDSDKVILLSGGYKDDYCKIGKISDKSKFLAIPNIFEVESNAKSQVQRKEKRVLILSRMDEIQKRMSLALQIWAMIEKDPDLKDWQLDIVGSGHNEDIVKRLIRKLKLKNITYHGWQPREDFLQKSSILMSTSEYEGLPLAILEAQAYGVVPIAFDSYASIRDVIEDGFNGVVIEHFGDCDTFAKKLANLMKDEKKRLQLAQNAVNSSGKFSSEKIGNQWLEMLEKL